MHLFRTNIWKNSFFVFLSQAIRLITNLLIFIGIPRLYGPEIFGQFSIAYTVATICIVIADFGFDVLLTTEIARNREDAARIGARYFSLKILFASISALIMIVIPSFQTFSAASRLLIYILTAFVVLTTFTNFFYAIFRGFEKFELETQISFTSNLILITLLAVFGLMRIQLVYLMSIFIFARLISVTLCGIKATRLVGKNICKINFSEWNTTINHVLIFGFHFIFGNLFFQLDTILLGFWKGDHAVGIYKSAFNIMTLVLLIPDIAIATMLPVLSRLNHEDIMKWKSVSNLLYKVLFLIAMPLTLTIFFMPEEIIKLLYGNRLFNEAIPVLKIFAMIIFVRYAVEPFALMLTTSRRQHVRLVIVMVATFASFGFNYWLIPTWGIMGAALVSLGVNLFVGIGYVSMNLSLFMNWTFDFRLLVSFFFGLLVLVSLSIISMHWIAQLGLILLCLPFIYFFGLSAEEKKMLFSSIVLKSI